LPISAVIHSEPATVHLLAKEGLLALDRAIHINKVRMGKTSWLAGPYINGNPDIEDVADVAEELVEVGIGHLESEVADEEGLGRRVLLNGADGPSRVVHDDASAFESAVVLGLNGCLCLLDTFKLDISESIE
jgi:hypothetical protein